MSDISTGGFTKGFAEVPYPAFDGGLPLLNTFYFRFDIPTDPDPVDNHLNSIMVLPGGASEDLSPSAENNPSNVSDGRLQVMLRDAEPTSAKDEYFYKIGHNVLRGAMSGRRYQVRDIGLGPFGTIRRELPASIFPDGAVAALCGFKLFYTGNRDHHVDVFQVEFIEDGKTLELGLNDANNDDVFGYLVDFIVLTPSPLNSIQTGTSQGHARITDQVELPPGPSHANWGIRGFLFNSKAHTPADRHIREFGILNKDRNLRVFHGDDIGSASFDWKVDWIDVAPPVFA